MTKNEIIKRVNYIANIAHDDECAHSCEDELMIDFIKFIAESGCEHSELAKLVLESQSLDFSRWCA